MQTRKFREQELVRVFACLGLAVIGQAHMSWLHDTGNDKEEQ